MASVSASRATLDDLLRIEGKAELIGGRIVQLMPSGDCPSAVAFRIAMSAHGHVKTMGGGKVYADGVGYAVPELPSGRESFSPDASYFDGPIPADRMRLLQGSPKFAGEVRSENDYGPVTELEMADKRADYFAAGTLVVWDVDPVAKTIACYRAPAPDRPVLFRLGDVADAEPAILGWRVVVSDVFDC